MEHNHKKVIPCVSSTISKFWINTFSVLFSLHETVTFSSVLIVYILHEVDRDEVKNAASPIDLIFVVGFASFPVYSADFVLTDTEVI